jgi:hypothetical protein
MPPELACAVHSLLARSPARFALVQLEDVLGQLDQVNLPGADVDRHPNWRRKLSLPLEQWAQCQAFATLTEAIAAERPGAPRRRGGAGRQALAIPRATYRLQLDATFGFRAASAIATARRSSRLGREARTATTSSTTTPSTRSSAPKRTSSASPPRSARTAWASSWTSFPITWE